MTPPAALTADEYPFSADLIDWEERRFAAEGGYDRYGECCDRPGYFEDAAKATGAA